LTPPRRRGPNATTIAPFVWGSLIVSAIAPDHRSIQGGLPTPFCGFKFSSTYIISLVVVRVWRVGSTVRLFVADLLIPRDVNGRGFAPQVRCVPVRTPPSSLQRFLPPFHHVRMRLIPSLIFGEDSVKYPCRPLISASSRSLLFPLLLRCVAPARTLA